VVVKRFNSADEEGHLRNEERRLRQVANLVPLVPKLIACDTGQLVLLLSPVGDNFASRLSHFTYPNIVRPSVLIALLYALLDFATYMPPAIFPPAA